MLLPSSLLLGLSSALRTHVDMTCVWVWNTCLTARQNYGHGCDRNQERKKKQKKRLIAPRTNGKKKTTLFITYISFDNAKMILYIYIYNENSCFLKNIYF